MEYHIKFDLENWLSSEKPHLLELGCGRSKKEGYRGIDKLDSPDVDIVADLEFGLPFIPDNSIEEIYSKSFLEHVDNFELLMKEILRVLKSTGRAHIYVPHFSNPYFYSDYTHRRFFGLYTFYYFVNQKYQLRRKVPDYYSNLTIKIISLHMEFTSPFLPIKVIKKMIEHIINSSSLLQEVYEESFCYLFPCYGINIVFAPEK